jgi:membrane protein implicated in regulation of membrane protease activity
MASGVDRDVIDLEFSHLGWLAVLVAAVAALWWSGFVGMAALLTVVSGLAGLAYLVVRKPQSQEADRDKRQGDAERDNIARG